jgi:hypothetical protein
VRRGKAKVKNWRQLADKVNMLVLLALSTLSYFTAVLWFVKTKRRTTLTVAPCLPDDDQPPPTAVGWPPEGDRFTEYVDQSHSALHAYLAGATPPEVS